MTIKDKFIEEINTAIDEGKTILTVVDTKEEKIVEQQEVKSEQEVNEVIKKYEEMVLNE